METNNDNGKNEWIKILNRFCENEEEKNDREKTCRRFATPQKHCVGIEKKKKLDEGWQGAEQKIEARIAKLWREKNLKTLLY